MIDEFAIGRIDRPRPAGPIDHDQVDGWEGIEGIVLDAVGTLIDPEPSVARAYAAAALRQGLVVDVAEVKRRFGRHFRNDEVDEQLGPMATDEAIEHRRWRRIVANVLPDLPDLDRGFEELWDHFGRPEAWRASPTSAPAWRRSARPGSRSGSPRTSTAGSGPWPPGCPSWPGSSTPW